MSLRAMFVGLCALTLLAPLGADAAKKKKAKPPAKTAPAAPEAPKADAAKPAEPKGETKPAETKPAENKAEPAPGADGKKVFVDHKCTKCHKVSALGLAAAAEKDTIVDLSGVGAQRDVSWLKKWVKKEMDKESSTTPGQKVKHKAGWKGSDAELDTLVAWLKGLTAKGK
ncbi:MAG: cytochrome c [Deltaproteobacteria bacterium]|nr:cytochrome c [Deltaproteobacteria bacterium]